MNKKKLSKGRNQPIYAITYSQHETIERNHGRIELRRYMVLPLMYMHQFKCRWSGLQSLVQVENHYQIKGGNKYLIFICKAI